MKLKNCVAGAFLLLCSFLAQAQDQKFPINDPDRNKPKLFADLPQKMEARISEMQNLFRHKVGAVISMHLSEQFLFEGSIVSKAEDAQVKSVVIRSTNRPGAVLSFSRTQHADGSEKFVGMIISRNNADAYEITKEKGHYVFIKKDLYDLMNE